MPRSGIVDLKVEHESVVGGLESQIDRMVQHVGRHVGEHNACNGELLTVIERLVSPWTRVAHVL